MSDNKVFWQEVHRKRNGKLEASDWTQMPDAPLTDAQKNEWAVYRQALRDVLNNLRNSSNYVSDDESCPTDGSILDWQWPTKPGA